MSDRTGISPSLLRDIGPCGPDMRAYGPGEICSLRQTQLGGLAYIRHKTPALRDEYLRIAAHSMRSAAESLRIAAMFAERQVPLMAIKGPLVAEFVFADAGAYPSVDMDFMIRPGDIELASAIMTQAGYEPLAPEAEASWSEAHFHLVFRRGSFVAELHWNMDCRLLSISPEAWWREAQSVEISGQPVLMPSRSTHAILLAVHLMRHGFELSKYLAFFSWFLHRTGCHRDEIIAEARALGAGGAVRFALALEGRVMGRGDGVRLPWAQRKMLDAVISRGGLGHAGSIALGAALADRPSDVARPLRRALLPTRAELSLRWGPSNMPLPLAYIANPFRLAAAMMKGNGH